MKILIIGGTGKIGQKIISNINLKEHEVFSISQKKIIKDKKIKSYRFDYYKNFVKVRKLITKYKFDVVINLICFNINQVKRDYNLYKNSVSKYLFISSTSVYKNTQNVILENSKTEITKNPYIVGKLKAEKFLKNNTKNFPYIILRICQIYGEDNIPTLFKKRSFTVLNDMYFNKRIFLPYGTHNNWKIIHVNDLANIIIKIFFSSNNSIKKNIFNIVPDKTYSWNQIYNMYSTINKNKFKKILFDVKILKNLNKEIYEHLILDKLKNGNFSNKKIFKIIKKPRFNNFEKKIKSIVKIQKNRIINTTPDQDIKKIFQKLISLK
jgi:nucleoside-diphosphate-sugar epimerase